MTIYGVDVSPVQGRPPWRDLAAIGVRFTIPRITVGATTADEHALEECDAAEEAGIDVAALYHWVSPSSSSRDQVANVVRALGSRRPRARIMLDFEDPNFAPLGPKTSIAIVEGCVRGIEDATGIEVLVYTGRWFAPWVAGGDSEILAARQYVHAAYPLAGRWARGGKTRAEWEAFAAALPAVDRLELAAPWAKRGKRPVIWQADGDNGLVMPNGVDVDVDEFLGSEADYARFMAPLRPKGPQIVAASTGGATMAAIDAHAEAEASDQLDPVADTERPR